MSWVTVAKKDFHDAMRSKTLWALTILFVLGVSGIAWVAAGTTSAGSGPTDEATLGAAIVAIFAMVAAIVFLVPLTGIVISTKAIVRERESGTVKLLLGLPHTRKEAVLGKLVGRAAVLAVSVLTGFLVAMLVFLTEYGDFPFVEYAMFAFVTVLTGTVFVALGIGVSGSVSTETRATVLSATVFVVFGYFWSPLVGFLNDQLGLLSGNSLRFAHRFNLGTMFVDAMLTLLSLTSDGIANGSVVVGGGSTDVVFLQNWFAFVIYGLWIVVPVAIGFYRFDEAEL